MYTELLHHMLRVGGVQERPRPEHGRALVDEAGAPLAATQQRLFERLFGYPSDERSKTLTEPLTLARYYPYPQSQP